MLTINTIKILFFIGCLTVSSDIFLVVNIGPNLRISQIIFLLISMNEFICIIKNNWKVINPLGFNWFMLWASIILIFIHNSGFIPKGIAYGFWMILNGIVVFCLVQVMSKLKDLGYFISSYIYSFVIIAFFGLIQFIAGIFGFNLLITSWWIPGIFPRLNGLSYEPSFFASYLIMGWILIAYFLKYDIFLLPKKMLKIYFSLISIVLILSGSRLGILFMCVWYLQYPLASIKRLLQGKIFKKDLLLFGYMLFLLMAMQIAFEVISGSEFFKIIAFGIGLGETSSHSIDERLLGYNSLIEIFLKSPFYGYSLGGLSHALGQLYGVSVNDFESAKLEGNGVFLEVLAASGIIGFIPFVIYFCKLLCSSVNLNHKLSIEYIHLLRAFVVALFFELLIIQPNQNVLRSYLWLHIAMLSGIYTAVKRNVGVRLEVVG